MGRLEKRQCESLYVEADEDHVAGQNGRTYMPMLVYVHEGKEKDQRRIEGSALFFWTLQ